MQLQRRRCNPQRRLRKCHNLRQRSPPLRRLRLKRVHGPWMGLRCCHSCIAFVMRSIEHDGTVCGGGGFVEEGGGRESFEGL